MIKITIPNDLYYELTMLEVDTWEPEHPSMVGMGPGRPAFVEAMENAKRSAKSYKVTLNEDAARYFVSISGAFDRSRDMWEDAVQGSDDREHKARNRKFIRQGTKLDDQVRTALGQVIGSPRDRVKNPGQNPTPEQAGCVLAKHAWDRDTVECGPDAPTPAQAAKILADTRWTLPPDVRKQKARLLR